MSQTKENYYELRSRSIQKNNTTSSNQQEAATQSKPYNNRTSTPEKSSNRRLENIRKSIQESGRLFQQVSELIDKSTSTPNLTSLFSITPPSYSMNQATYNKELADLMANNIPKFELHSSSNPALELRSFINSCENVLNLYPRNNDIRNEFFKLIKFRLGYNVQERITQNDFDSIKDLENHLRSICHIKLNKGKLLNQIRHERQLPNEDVSQFVERLRKLIAQGRSEYSRDTEFEKEAIHTLKNAVRNELISIKLLDSTTDKFEELAEIAINRDSELHQRSYNTTKSDQALLHDTIINELVQKIKNLEAKQTASIQHIRDGSLPQTEHTLPNKRPQHSGLFCNYCKRTGHSLDNCRSKPSNQRNYNTDRPGNFNNPISRTHFPPRNYRNPNFFPNRNNAHNRRSPSPINRNNDYRQYEDTYQRQRYNTRNQFQQSKGSDPQELPSYNFRNNPNRSNLTTCLRCNQEGHTSINCYEMICRTCKQLGHISTQCQQSTTQRRVHFLNCNENLQPNYHSQDSDPGNAHSADPIQNKSTTNN